MVQKIHDIQAPAQATIDTAALAMLVRSDIDMVLIDARGPAEGISFIPGSKLLAVKSTASEVAEVIPDKRSLVVTYCADLHCPASMEMYKHLKNLGYENVIDYPDGIEGWKAAGYPAAEVGAA